MYNRAFCLHLLVLLSSVVVGSPVHGSTAAIPTLSLPWGKYTAVSVDSQDDVYIYQNVRFGRSMAGNLRFTKSSYPDPVEDPTLQDQTYGPGCISWNRNGVKSAPSGTPPPFRGIPQEESEDCLFLDIYASKNALSNNKKNIPVIVWIYGGAYIFGSKDQQYPNLNVNVYTGTPWVRTAIDNGEEAIVVIGNYRLGAYGWLAGTEVSKNGYANAGLSDQRLVLKFVQDFIDQIGGDRTQVSAWGESAGGGSIIHHLVRDGGKSNPLFSKAVVQSPAYQWMWNQTTIDGVFDTFAANVPGCQGQGLSCLQDATPAAILAANNKTLADMYSSEALFAFGPVVDGSLIQQLPSLLLEKGSFASLDSLIVSHVYMEANMFVKSSPNCAYYQQLVVNSYPGQVPVQKQILTNPAYDFTDCADHIIDVVADSCFFGNTRQLIDAYSGPSTTVYATSYQFPLYWAAYHGLDLIPTFFLSSTNVSSIVCAAAPSICGLFKWFKFDADYAAFSIAYQRYLVSHAVTGNPNTWNTAPNIPWGTVQNGENALSNVLTSKIYQRLSGNTPGIYFENTVDQLNLENTTSFWRNIAQEVSPASPSYNFPVTSGSEQKVILDDREVHHTTRRLQA